MQRLNSRRLTELVLASASPRRLELLQSLGLRVDVVPSEYEEREIPGYGPEQLARYHAERKAEDVIRRRPDRVVVAADTVVDVDGQAWGKPRDRADARRMLTVLAGRDHLVHSAYCVVTADGRIVRCSTAGVRFYPLGGEEIEAYLRLDEWPDKAGAYGIQGRGATLVERVDGDFYAVMGLPLGSFVRALPELGLRV